LPTCPNDSADLLALQSGDDRALDRLIARWERPLYGFAWRYLHHEADARDVATESFVRLYQQRMRLRPDSKVAAWLFTTATNHCRNQHRWRRRHPSVPLDNMASDGSRDSGAYTAIDEAPTPDDALLHKEALAALEQALAALPHDLKTVLLLHQFERLSYREIGAITGCRERGVETRLYRARQLLREAVIKLMREPAGTGS
jgi:RNA polymerase sigma-70 factor (ECF subfamily)